MWKSLQDKLNELPEVDRREIKEGARRMYDELRLETGAADGAVPKEKPEPTSKGTSIL